MHAEILFPERGVRLDITEPSKLIGIPRVGDTVRVPSYAGRLVVMRVTFDYESPVGVVVIMVEPEEL